MCYQLKKIVDTFLGYFDPLGFFLSLSLNKALRWSVVTDDVVSPCFVAAV